jgi:hypothetical protein
MTDMADVEKIEHPVAENDPLAQRPVPPQRGGEIFEREEFIGWRHARASLHGGMTASRGLGNTEL